MWIAHYRASPFGDDRADLRSAQITKMIYDVNVGKKGSARKITDFLPFHRKPKQDPDINQTVRSAFANLIKRKD